MPKEMEYDSVNCYDYVINTTMNPIDITIPASMVSEPSKFAQQMINVETRNLIALEQKEWNGIWARILSNYMTTANLGKFDIIVGNPPWVDWKSLPSGYRDKIKSLCISRKLFSGDRLTGGINLNICALIANVVAENWLSEQGILGLLMPESLVFQQSYEGFRNFYIGDDKRMYFCQEMQLIIRKEQKQIIM